MNREMEVFNERMLKQLHEVKTSKKAAREYLTQLGLLTKKGKLRKKFKFKAPAYYPYRTDIYLQRDEGV